MSKCLSYPNFETIDGLTNWIQDLILEQEEAEEKQLLLSFKVRDIFFAYLWFHSEGINKFERSAFDPNDHNFSLNLEERVFVRLIRVGDKAEFCQRAANLYNRLNAMFWEQLNIGSGGGGYQGGDDIAYIYLL